MLMAAAAQALQFAAGLRTRLGSGVAACERRRRVQNEEGLNSDEEGLNSVMMTCVTDKPAAESTGHMLDQGTSAK